MKKTDLERILKAAGWEIVRQGNHEIWGKDGKTVPIPRHKEIKENTIRDILKKTGIQE